MILTKNCIYLNISLAKASVASLHRAAPHLTQTQQPPLFGARDGNAAAVAAARNRTCLNTVARSMQALGWWHHVNHQVSSFRDCGENSCYYYFFLTQRLPSPETDLYHLCYVPWRLGTVLTVLWSSTGLGHAAAAESVGSEDRPPGFTPGSATFQLEHVALATVYLMGLW